MRYVAGGISYDTLCARGKSVLDDIDRDTGETRRLAGQLSNAEEYYYSQIPYYRDQLAKLKDLLRNHNIRLQRHVAHCADGCKRTQGQASSEATRWSRAPSHDKPKLPGAATLAAMIQQGQTCQGIAAVYERHVSTITARLSTGGYSAVDGRPLESKARPQKHEEQEELVLPFEVPPWVDDAFCAQTDPDAFFPEKGGSTSQAKAVCCGDGTRQRPECPVRAQCLEYSLEHAERFGIWGGYSERERRQMFPGIAALWAQLDELESA